MHAQHQSLAQIRTLLRKECRVWFWPFVLYAVAYLYGAFNDLVIQGNDLNLNENYATLLYFYGFFVPVLVGVKLAAGEASQRTLQFTSSLPCRLQTAAWVRLAVAATVVAVPPFLGALLEAVFIVARTERLGPGFNTVKMLSVISLFKGVTVMCAEHLGLMLLVAVIGAKRQSETQVGAFGALVAIGQFLLRSVILTSSSVQQLHLELFGILVPSVLLNPQKQSTSPMSRFQLQFTEYVWAPLGLHVLILLGLAIWFSRRYGQVREERSANRLSLFDVRSVTQSFIRSPRGALIWLNLRQTLPLAVAGWIMGFLIAGFILIIERSFRSADHFGRLLMESLLPVGVLWPAIIGAGIFATELRRDVGHFWRSRPISPTEWFWVKYVSGLIAVVVSLDILPLLIAILFGLIHDLIGVRSMYYYPAFLAHMACFPIIHIASYTLAVLGVTWLRRPALIVVVCVMILLGVEISVDSHPHLGKYSMLQIAQRLSSNANTGSALFEYVVTYGTVTLLIVLVAWLATRAIRRTVLQPLTTPLNSLAKRLGGAATSQT